MANNSHSITIIEVRCEECYCRWSLAYSGGGADPSDVIADITPAADRRAVRAGRCPDCGEPIEWFTRVL